MMILRHNSLKPPYDDYNKLSAEDFNALGSQTIDPPIADITVDTIGEDIRNEILNCRYIICSQSSRTQDSAAQILKSLHITKEIRIDPILNEIWFESIKIFPGLSDGELLSTIRKKFYLCLKNNGEFMEKAVSVFARLNKIMEMRGTNVVCFSHGFLMRFLKAYSDANCDMDKTFDIVQRVDPVIYLKGFKI